METKFVQKDMEEVKKQTINKAVRICINCGSLSVRIENYGIFCKECDTFFDVKEETN